MPFETIINERKDEYYHALERSDKEGKSTLFIEFMLSAIDQSFNELLKVQTSLNSSQDRMNYFINIFTGKTFTRKDYMNIFKDISPATASRDLLHGVENHLLDKQGDKRTTIYHVLE